MVFHGCAACKMQRKKCSEQCILAPHFPSDDPHKFALVHRMFGTCRIIKMLQGVEGYQRTDAVKSMVYEATARAKDPVHGTASAIHQLRKQIAELQTQLAATQKEVFNMRSQYDKLVFQNAQSVQYTTEISSNIIEDKMYDNLVFLHGTGSMGTQHVQYTTEAPPQQNEDMMFDDIVSLLGAGSQAAQCVQYSTDAQPPPVEDMIYAEEEV